MYNEICTQNTSDAAELFRQKHLILFNLGLIPRFPRVNLKNLLLHQKNITSISDWELNRCIHEQVRLIQETTEKVEWKGYTRNVHEYSVPTHADKIHRRTRQANRKKTLQAQASRRYRSRTSERVRRLHLREIHEERKNYLLTLHKQALEEKIIKVREAIRKKTNQR